MILIIGLVAFAFWYGVRFGARKNRREGSSSDVVEKAELDGSALLGGGVSVRGGKRGRLSIFPLLTSQSDISLSPLPHYPCLCAFLILSGIDT